MGGLRGIARSGIHIVVQFVVSPIDTNKNIRVHPCSFVADLVFFAPLRLCERISF